MAYLCMQGGGVYIYNGCVDFTSCNLHDNDGGLYVSARIFELLDPSSIAPLNSDTFALF